MPLFRFYFNKYGSQVCRPNYGFKTAGHNNSQAEHSELKFKEIGKSPLKSLQKISHQCRHVGGLKYSL